MCDLALTQVLIRRVLHSKVSSAPFLKPSRAWLHRHCYTVLGYNAHLCEITLERWCRSGSNLGTSNLPRVAYLPGYVRSCALANCTTRPIWSFEIPETIDRVFARPVAVRPLEMTGLTYVPASPVQDPGTWKGLRGRVWWRWGIRRPFASCLVVDGGLQDAGTWTGYSALPCRPLGEADGGLCKLALVCRTRLPSSSGCMEEALCF